MKWHQWANLELVSDDGGIEEASVDALEGQIGGHQGPFRIEFYSLDSKH